MAAAKSGSGSLTAYLAVAGCLLLFFYFALSTALAKAATVDEPLHLIRAVALRQTGDLSLQGEHAPLSHRLAGLFLGSAEVPALHELSSWASGDRREIALELLWESGIDVDKTLFLARLPIIYLGVLLGALTGSWALRWQGKLALVMVLVLFATAPNLIAHSALVTTDLAAAVTYFAAVYAWWRYWRQPRFKWWLLAAIFLGLALATKLTAILLLPVMLILALVGMRRWHAFWRSFWIWAALLPPALIVLWLVYGLQLGPLAGWSLPIPAPAYGASWQSVLSHMEEGHLSYFLGELSTKGWRTYFPVTFVMKTPLVTLLLLITALLVVIRQPKLWRTAFFLLLPVGVLFAAAIASNLNIGYRHILPALPFLLVFAAAAVRLLQRWQLTRILLALGLSWAVISAFRQNPHHLAYFNEAVGGTAQGYRYLGDSNLDWGQDINLLASTIASKGGEWIVSYDGTNDPLYYGIPKDSLFEQKEAGHAFSAANPAPGQYAISANHLQGHAADADLFDWFRHRQPTYNLGGSILVYEVAEQAHGQWIAQCLDPLPLLSNEKAQALVGSGNVRHLFFDCRQSLVLADGGNAPGWFIFPQADSWWFQEPLPVMAAQMQLVYRHDAAAGLPSFDVYYWSGSGDVPLPEGWIQSAENEDGMPVVLPRALNDMAQITAYQVSGAQWFVQWVIRAATTEPLTLLAHLYTDPAGPADVGDGLGFSSDQWRPGDWLLQRHAFPGQENALFLQTGMYNYQTVERLGETVNLRQP